MSAADLTIWHALSDRATDVLSSAIERFQSDHPGVTVTAEKLDGVPAMIASWRAALPQDRPNLVLLSEDYVGPMAGDPDVVPFTGCFDAGALVPQVEGTFTAGGELVGAPFAISVPVLFYDRLKLERAGIEPDVGQISLAELRDLSATMVESGLAPGGLAIETGELSGGSWYVEQVLAKSGAQSLLPDNGRSGAAERVAWNDAAAVDALTLLRSMVDGGLTTRTDEGGFGDLLALVDAESPAAFAVHTSGSLGDALEYVAALPHVSLGVAPMPGGDGPTVLGGSAWFTHDDQTPAEQQATWALVERLTSPAVQAELAAATGYVPVTAASIEEPVLAEALAAAPQLRVAIDGALAAEPTAASLVPVHAERPALRALLASAVRAVIDGTASPREALDGAVEDAAALLAS